MHFPHQIAIVYMLLLPASVVPIHADAPATRPAASFINTIGMKFVRIAPGEFMMGSPDSEKGRFPNETQHKVTLTHGFMMAVTTVTQGQWKAVMGTTVAEQRDKVGAQAILVGQGDALPMYYASWDEAVDFCKKLSQTEGKHYRLATEAEWEYACRAGAQGRYGGSGNLDEMGWFGDNSGDRHFDSNDFWKKDAAHYDQRVVTEYHCRPHPVGEKKPNAWGLYDMHGNVWEWCNDFHGDYPASGVFDPAGPQQGTARVLRGGAWNVRPDFCRSAFRHKHGPDSRNYYIGFRVCLDFTAFGERWQQ
jgi:formylglycine-generating enzyme required for sulfatase activity